MKKARLIILFAILITGCAYIYLSKTSYDYRESDFRQGDVLFQALGGELCDVIADVTESPLTHCGMVVEKDGKLFIIEALGTVKYTSIPEWISRTGEFLHLRPEGIDEKKIAASALAAKEYLGRPYDMQYELDEEKQYCSELVYKAYMKGAGVEIGEKIPLGEMNWKPNEAFIRRLAGGELPLDREIISPVSVTETKYLKKIYSNMD